MVEKSDFVMSDEEITELGSVTLHGALPQTTVMRLHGGATRLIEERKNLKKDYEGACITIAQMHEAVSGKAGEGPKRGVVEDVQDAMAFQRRLVKAVSDLLVTSEKLDKHEFYRVVGRKTMDALADLVAPHVEKEKSAAELLAEGHDIEVFPDGSATKVG